MIVDCQVSSHGECDPLYADVIVPRHLAGPFTYRIPEALQATLRVGLLVQVPFGRSVIQGAVISLTSVPPQAVAPERLKEIRAVATNGSAAEIPAHLLQLAKRVAETYAAPWGQCLRLVMPPHRSSAGNASRYCLTLEGKNALAAMTASSEARGLLQRLKKRPLGIKGETLQGGKNRGQMALLASLVTQGWVREVLEPAAPLSEIQRDFPIQADHSLYGARIHSPTNVSSYPNGWEDRIVQAIKMRQAGRLLVEASGEQRLALLRDVVMRTADMGLTVLVIVGEVERAESITAALSEYGVAAGVCLHSGLSENHKADIWDGIQQCRIRVVVGTRSAVFLPLRSLGLIWIERDEDPALKEPKEPRYHAREVAWLRAQEEKALLVMASAHLSLEARAGVDHGALLLQNPLRREGLPTIEVVDLREQSRGAVLSAPLVDAMREAIIRQAGVLLFLNRKGYAGALICQDCGQVPRCPSCHVAFAYYRQKGTLRCSYCGTTTSIPDICPACAAPRLRLVGEGTERVEEDVTRWFPRATVLRVDGETMRKPKQAAALWARIQQRQWDVLVGTQLLLREDAPCAVGLVGVVQADTGLSLPDFRAAERAYHLLAGARALALPASDGGRMIVQTYLPSHHAIQAVVQGDETIFTSEELAHRTALGYPPAVHLIALHVSGNQEQLVEKAARAWVARLSLPAANIRASQQITGGRQAVKQVDGLTILGPVPPPVPQLRGRFRRQILVKSAARDAAAYAVREAVEALEKNYPSRLVKFDVDVDPLDMW